MTRFYPRAEAERLLAALLSRIAERCYAELVPFGVQLWRHSGLDDAAAALRWDDEVGRLVAEELAQLERELAAVEVHGCA